MRSLDDDIIRWRVSRRGDDRFIGQAVICEDRRMTDASISFPRQNARTLGFSLGVPHAFAIAPDGSRIAFLRARSGTDRSTGLWARDTATGAERLVAHPHAPLAGGEETLPPQERARPERTPPAPAGGGALAAAR